MPRIQPISPDLATGQTQELFDLVNDHLGMVPNFVRTLGHSPAALQGYLSLSQALEGGQLSAEIREQIALAISEDNGCSYCVSAHAVAGKSIGLSDNEITDARQSSSPDSKVNAALRFARLLQKSRGWVSDNDVNLIRDADFSDGEIAEIVAIVAWKTFSNYFNHVALTEIDFPAVAEVSLT